MSSQYGEHRPTSLWDLLASFGHFCKFQRVPRLGSVTAATSLTGGQPNFARCLAVSCAATLYVHFQQLLPRDGILPRAKFTLYPASLELSYWQRYCTALEQWARAKLCGVEHRAPPIFGRATITLALAHILVINLMLNLPVKELRKSINIWRGYKQAYSGTFLDSHHRPYMRIRWWCQTTLK